MQTSPGHASAAQFPNQTPHPAPTSVVDAERALAVLLEQKAALDHRIIETVGFINASRPINRLPLELLVHIFHCARDVLPSPDYITSKHYHSSSNPPWYPMIAVCRLWYTIFLATPKLWSLVEITARTQIERVKAALLKSATHPIELIIDDPGPRIAPRFIPQLHPHSTRIGTFHCKDVPRRDAECVSRFVHKSLPVLRELSLWFDPAYVNVQFMGLAAGLVIEEGEVFNFEISEERLPRLRELSLRGVGLQGPLPWGECRPPPLTRLELRDSTNPGTHIVEFMFFLQSLPELEDLTLVRFRPLDIEHLNFTVYSNLADLEPLPVVTFGPKLRNLVIQDIDIYVARLLSGLKVPVSTDVDIVKMIAPADHAELRVLPELLEVPHFSCLPEDKDGLPILRRAFTVRVSQSHSSTYAVVSTDTNTCCIGVKAPKNFFHDYPPADVLTSITTLLADAPITDLCVDNLWDVGLTKRTWINALKRIPRLKRLTVFIDPKASEETLDPLLRALRSGTKDNLLCPDLEELHLNTPASEGDDEETVSAICDCLAARQRLGCKRLKTLCVELADPDSDDVIDPSSISVGNAADGATLASLADDVECSHRVYGHDLAEELLDLRVLMEDVCLCCPIPDSSSSVDSDADSEV